MHVVWHLSLEFLLLKLNWLVWLSADSLGKNLSKSLCLDDID